jgi:hypothetical protein
MGKKSWLWTGGALAVGTSYSLVTYACQLMTRAKKHSKQQCLELQREAGLLPPEWLEELNRRQLEITSQDNLTLRGWLLPGKQPVERVMIMVHGYTVSASWMLHFALPFLERGWTVLLVDQRAHGASEGRYATYGFMEKYDLDAWISWVVGQYGEEAVIGLLGQSMGGATVLEYAAINQRACFIVADCAYSDMGQLIKHQMGHLHHLPVHPLYRLVDIRLHHQAGFRMQDVSPLRAVVDRPDLPVMFVHGDRDDFVPTQMSLDMYQAKSGKKKLLLVPGAGHARAFFTDRELYAREMFAFIDDALQRGREEDQSKLQKADNEKAFK